MPDMVEPNEENEVQKKRNFFIVFHFIYGQHCYCGEKVKD